MKMKRLVLPVFYIVAALSGSSAGTATAADIAALTGPCEDCHGKDGVSQDKDIPSIAGYSAVYITDSLGVYRDKTRPCEDEKYPTGAHKGETTNMCKIAEKISEQDGKLIADYFAGKKFVAAKQPFDAELAKKGKGIHELNCKKCHEDGGSSADDDAGLLAGQWLPYLERQFKEFKAGKREMEEKMKPKMEKLTADDIKALLQYYASEQ